MKVIHHFNTARDKLLHIETEGAIVNIRVGLHDTQGQEVTSIEILPDDGSTDERWTLNGTINNRVIKVERAEPSIVEAIRNKQG